jgi:hypothetical protein
MSKNSIHPRTPFPFFMPRPDGSSSACRPIVGAVGLFLSKTSPFFRRQEPRPGMIPVVRFQLPGGRHDRVLQARSIVISPGGIFDCFPIPLASGNR